MSGKLTIEKLRDYFHLPIQTAASELGVCATAIKKLCRSKGIKRWPHRKIQALDNQIQQLQYIVDKDTTTEEIRRVRRGEIEVLKQKKALIIANPNTPIQLNPKPAGAISDGSEYDDEDEETEESEGEQSAQKAEVGPSIPESETTVPASFQTSIPVKPKATRRGRKRRSTVEPQNEPQETAKAIATTQTMDETLPAKRLKICQEGEGGQMDFEKFSATQSLPFVQPLTELLEVPQGRISEIKQIVPQLVFTNVASIMELPQQEQQQQQVPVSPPPILPPLLNIKTTPTPSPAPHISPEP